ncbi:S-adenosyl-L-methionine-dependent methyltransferase [Pelagophyceae sp. CCMP2097]|nr:S-adenosyl-L-methionine-dependent methyltransferase [Pelagophyceae sp. CCMP2097]
MDPSKRFDGDTRTDGMDRFQCYYREHQRLITDEDEWRALEAVLRTPLPFTFRLPRSDERVFQRLVHEAADLDAVELKWYGAGGAWSFDLLKDPARKAWLVAHGTRGTAVRQEAVSMLPALLLCAEEGDVVLDCCAAPGNKTAQLLELVGANGLVFANDADAKRAYMLSHQLTRLGPHVAQRLIVAAADAGAFPFLAGAGFDRVLCDAPCSGDGTLRKAPRNWRSWRCREGLRCHATQLRLSWRCAQLLKTGGTLVYSTCALNPIENEAVVSALLRRAGGALELVDAHAALADRGWATARRGLETWRVCIDDAAGGIAALPEAFADLSPDEKCRVSRSMFPTTDGQPLQRCARIYPHDGNTGGFFIALLRKVRDFDDDDERPQKAAAKGTGADAAVPPAADCAPAARASTDGAASTTADGAASTTAAALPDAPEDGDGQYRPLGSTKWAAIVDFFGLRAEALPWRPCARSDGTQRAVWLLSAGVAAAVESLQRQGVRVVYAGTKCLAVTGGGAQSQLDYRVTAAGATLLAGADAVGAARFVKVDDGAFDALLAFAARGAGAGVGFDELPEPLALELRVLAVGSVVAVARNASLPLWRGAAGVRVMLAADDADFMAQNRAHDRSEDAAKRATQDP